MVNLQQRTFICYIEKTRKATPAKKDAPRKKVKTMKDEDNGRADSKLLHDNFLCLHVYVRTWSIPGDKALLNFQLNFVTLKANECTRFCLKFYTVIIRECFECGGSPHSSSADGSSCSSLQEMCLQQRLERERSHLVARAGSHRPIIRSTSRPSREQAFCPSEKQHMESTHPMPWQASINWKKKERGEPEHKRDEKHETKQFLTNISFAH